jgi:hypothetical protein
LPGRRLRAVGATGLGLHGLRKDGMDSLIAALAFAVLCAAWVLLQRWIASVDGEVGSDPHCGRCCNEKLCELERRQDAVKRQRV